MTMTKRRKVPVAHRRSGQKRAVLAASDEIDQYREIAARVMRDLFELEPDDYLITDESTLRDFTFFGMSDTAPTWAHIKERYGLSRNEVGSESLFHLFAAIARARSVH
jgi:hypothetical protein